jgi:hypothetical protein
MSEIVDLVINIPWDVVRIGCTTARPMFNPHLGIGRHPHTNRFVCDEFSNPRLVISWMFHRPNP